MKKNMLIFMTLIFVFLAISISLNNVSAQYEYGVSLSCDEREKQLSYTDNTTIYEIRIENTGKGNTWEKIVLSKNGTPKYWNSSLETSTMILNQGESKNVSLYVRAPSNVYWDEAIIEVNAKVIDGSSGPSKMSVEDSVSTITTVIGAKPKVFINETLTIKKTNKIFTIKGTSKLEIGKITKVQGKIDGGIWQDANGTTNWSYKWDLTGVKEGIHTISIRAFDGNKYSEIDSININVINDIGEESEDGFKAIYIISIIGIISCIEIICFYILYRKLSLISKTHPIEQQRLEKRNQIKTHQPIQPSPAQTLAKIPIPPPPQPQFLTEISKPSIVSSPKTCQFCGAEISDQNKFCAKCGKKQE